MSTKEINGIKIETKTEIKSTAEPELKQAIASEHSYILNTDKGEEILDKLITKATNKDDQSSKK